MMRWLQAGAQRDIEVCLPSRAGDSSAAERSVKAERFERARSEWAGCLGPETAMQPEPGRRHRSQPHCWADCLPPDRADAFLSGPPGRSCCCSHRRTGMFWSSGWPSRSGPSGRIRHCLHPAHWLPAPPPLPLGLPHIGSSSPAPESRGRCSGRAQWIDTGRRAAPVPRRRTHTSALLC